MFQREKEVTLHSPYIYKGIYTSYKLISQKFAIRIQALFLDHMGEMGKFSDICMYRINKVGGEKRCGEKLICISLTCLPLQDYLEEANMFVINLTQVWLHQLDISNCVQCSWEYPSTASPAMCSNVTHKVFLMATYGHLIITILG